MSRDKWDAPPLRDLTISPMARELLVELEMTELTFTQKLDVLAQTMAAIVWGEVSRESRRLKRTLDFIDSCASACLYFQIQTQAQCRKFEKSK